MSDVVGESLASAASVLSGDNNGIKQEDGTSITDNSAITQNNNKPNGEKKKKRRKKSKSKQAPKPKQQAAPAKDDVEVEYVSAHVLSESDPNFSELNRIFSRFMTPEQLTKPDESTKTNDASEAGNTSGNGATGASALDQHVAMEEAETQKLSKKKLKKLKQLSISQLKQLVQRPDVVEIHDVTAPDPKLLVQLKSYKNTVPVPRHWSQKRKYLQGKRGIEKPPFQLPDFIRATGIQEVRESHREAEEKKKAKQKARERILPKMGKIDIDFNVLHDAFFKFQTKPKLTGHGDLYYEGKENEVKLQHLKPGFLSERLRNALGMPPGAPPPWLINMQRFGPPPSYPSLKIPGLNAPIPEGASWGYHPGGWGRPPVDEQGRPLYGDVFRKKEQEVTDSADYDKQHNNLYRSLILNLEDEESIQLRERREKWGTIAEEQVTEEQPKLLGARDESDEEEEEEEEDTKMSKEALASGTTSVPVGVETPDVISLRKNMERPSMVAQPPVQHQLPPPPAPVKRENEPPRQLYQVIEQQPVAGMPSNQLMGSTFKYNLSGPSSASAIVDSVSSSYEETMARSTGESEASTSQEEESKKRKREEEKKKKKEREKKKIKF